MLSEKKLALSDNLVQSKGTVTFPTLNEYWTSVDVNHEELLKIKSQHLKELSSNFDHCFPKHEDPRQGNFWINDLFNEDISKCNLDHRKKEKLIELSCDSTIQSRY